jgi:hypothetical protein
MTFRIPVFLNVILFILYTGGSFFNVTIVMLSYVKRRDSIMEKVL